MVDLALLFAELLRVPGVTQADLGRRYRKSPGYVSVVCRLGHALRDVPPEARDALRVRHFTLKAAQALVSRHPGPDALRDAAFRLARTPARPRTRARAGAPGQWGAAPAQPDALDPLPEPPDAMGRRDQFVYAWNAELARRDPAAALAGFEAFVRATTDEVVRRLRHAAGDDGPLPALGPTTRAGRPAAPRAADDTALRLLHQRVRDTLRAHRTQMEEFVADRGRALERRAAAGRGGSLPPLEVDPGELEADLLEADRA